MCDQDLFLNVSNFIVKQLSPLSDHSQFITWLNIYPNSSTLESPENDSLTCLPKLFVWESDSTQKFKDCLCSPVLETLIWRYINDSTQINDVNTSLEKVENILIRTTKQCLKIKFTKKRTYAYQVIFK